LCHGGFPLPSCQGTNQDSDYCNVGNDDPYVPPNDPEYLDCIDYSDPTEPSYYCTESYDEPTDSTGHICCPVGYEAQWDADLGFWYCGVSQPCYNYPGALCGFSYLEDFASWLGDPDCLTPNSLPTASSACCFVGNYGGFGYYTDSANVEIY
jgi:hypothetical protein